MQRKFRRQARSLIALALLGLAMGSGLPAAQVRSLAESNQNSGVTTGAILSTWVSLAGPTVPGGTVDALAVAPSNPDTLYGLLQGPAGERLYRSNDVALTWQAVYTFTAAVAKLAVDPTVTSTVYAGAPDGLFRSTDDGLHWTQVYTLGQQIVVVSPTLIYAGGVIGPNYGAPGCHGNVLGVARSRNGGASWQVHAIGCGDWMNGLVVSPTDPDRVYASADQYPVFFGSDDGGQTWNPLPPTGAAAPVANSDLVIDPQDPARLYASDLFGLIVSADAGQHWARTLGPQCGSCRLAASGGSVYAVVRAPGSVAMPIYRSDDGGQTCGRRCRIFQRPRARSSPTQPITMYCMPRRGNMACSRVRAGAARGLRWTMALSR